MVFDICMNHMSGHRRRRMTATNFQHVQSALALASRKRERKVWCFLRLASIFRVSRRSSVDFVYGYLRDTARIGESIFLRSDLACLLIGIIGRVFSPIRDRWTRDWTIFWAYRKHRYCLPWNERPQISSITERYRIHMCIHGKLCITPTGRCARIEPFLRQFDANRIQLPLELPDRFKCKFYSRFSLTLTSLF